MRKWTLRLITFCLLSMGMGWMGLTWVNAKSPKKPVKVTTLPKQVLPPTALLRKGTKLRAPSGNWSWFGIAGTKCGYGSRTGMAINPSPLVGADTLVIMLQGGGACWKETGALGGCFSLPRSAFGLKGINKRTFKTGMRQRRIRNAFILRRSMKANPLKQAHYALLPYCTGDLHAGNAKVTYRKGRTIYHHGHANMIAYLKRLVPTFSKVKRVILAGVSAGGVGASLHWQRVQRAFGPKVRVDLLNDAGAPLNPIAGRWETWRKRWQLQLPDGCKNCNKGIAQILTYYKTSMLKRGGKMAFLGHTDDRIIRTFLGMGFYGNVYRKKLKGAMSRFDKLPNANYFILHSRSHAMLFRRNAHLLKGKGGNSVTLKTWLTQFVKRDAKWKSVKP